MSARGCQPTVCESWRLLAGFRGLRSQGAGLSSCVGHASCAAGEERSCNHFVSGATALSMLGGGRAPAAVTARPLPAGGGGLGVCPQPLHALQLPVANPKLAAQHAARDGWTVRLGLGGQLPARPPPPPPPAAPTRRHRQAAANPRPGRTNDFITVYCGTAQSSLGLSGWAAGRRSESQRAYRTGAERVKKLADAVGVPLLCAGCCANHICGVDGRGQGVPGKEETGCEEPGPPSVPFETILKKGQVRLVTHTSRMPSKPIGAKHRGQVGRRSSQE